MAVADWERDVHMTREPTRGSSWGYLKNGYKSRGMRQPDSEMGRRRKRLTTEEIQTAS